MKEVQTLKFSQMRGGKICAIILISLSIILLIVSIMVLDRLGDLLSFVSILVANSIVIYITWRTYQTAFTTITFSGDSIISESRSDSDSLDVSDIKGIWFSKNYQLPDMTFELYTPETKIPSGSLVVIGDIDSFSGAEFITVNGLNCILKDCFWTGYTTVHYRKSLKQVLDYYYNQIHQ